MLKHVPFVVAAVIGAVLPAAAQSEPQINTDQILTALRAIRDKQTESLKGQRSKIIQDFQSKAANNAAALEFYEAAIKATQFQGENRAQTQFVEWKKKEGPKLKSRDFQNALRLHLNYLAITLQRGGGTAVKDLLPSLYSHTQQVLTEQESGAGNDDLLRKKLDQSIFVRWYQIGSWLTGIDEWELAPGNVDNIFLKTILPELRKLKDPRAVDYWDGKLRREAAQASKSSLAFDTGKFEQIRKPTLLWSRAEEVLSIGQKSRAVTDMFALIKAYPAHPDALGWMTRLEQVLTGADSEKPAGSASTP